MKYSVIDLFAGAGGFGLGFHLCEYDLVLSLEKDDWAIKTIKVNQINSQKVIHSDIKKFRSKKDIKKVCDKNPDIIIGGPPCQGFSIAGIKKRDSNDVRNLLFKYFIKWVKTLKPKIFIMENVKGILSWENEKGEKIIDLMKESLSRSGYKIEIWKLNAAEYGVPQNRERIFVVGNLFNSEVGMPPKTHSLTEIKNKSKSNSQKKSLLKPVTVWDALSDLPQINAGEGEVEQLYLKNPQNKYQKWIRKNNNNVFNHISMKHTSRLIERFKIIQSGDKLSDVPLDYQVKKRNGKGKLSDIEFNSNYRHLKKNNISFTIPAHFYSSFIHPTKPRNITAREAARLQSFPDFYKFEGKRTIVSSKLLKRLGKHEENFLSQYNQIGNAVPPLLAKAIAKHIKVFLNANIQKETLKNS